MGGNKFTMSIDMNRSRKKKIYVTNIICQHYVIFLYTTPMQQGYIISKPLSPLPSPLGINVRYTLHTIKFN